MLADYELLKLFWWGLIGIVLIAFAIMDGFDLGVAGLLPVLGRNDTKRRIMINTIAPHWDGNQVWFIVAGGAVFAAWPLVYATLFSGFYWAMLLVLFALMARPIALEYRAKVGDKYKKYCDIGLVFSGVIPALAFGAVFGNLFQGFGFTFDQTLRSSFTESFWHLLNPFGLWCAALSLVMLLMHGAAWLKLRTEGELFHRASRYMQLFAVITLIMFIIGGGWVAQIPGYKVVLMHDTGSVMNPLMKEVVIADPGSWLSNYELYPITYLAPIAGCLGLLLTALLARTRSNLVCFLSSALGMTGVIATAGCSLFPFIFPSSINPNASLTVWDATSSQLTLSIMTVAALIIIPIIFLYTGWCLWKMRGKVTERYIEDNTNILY